MRPCFVQITAAAVLPERALLARIDQVAALPAEARAAYAVQLRDPEMEGRALYRLGEALREKTLALGARLVVNDRLDLARGLGADGVHLGRRSVSVADARAFLGEGAWISVSCHAIEEVGRAALEGADAALLSPIFDSPGKGAPLGLGALREACARWGRGIQILALGGVGEENAGDCFAAGATGVAAIRADLAPSVLRRANGCYGTRP